VHFAVASVTGSYVGTNVGVGLTPTDDAAVGRSVGVLVVGFVVDGAFVGGVVGFDVGTNVGVGLTPTDDAGVFGAAVGVCVGSSVGVGVVGRAVGRSVGVLVVGFVVDGAFVGDVVGFDVGLIVVGRAVGRFVGIFVDGLVVDGLVVVGTFVVGFVVGGLVAPEQLISATVASFIVELIMSARFTIQSLTSAGVKALFFARIPTAIPATSTEALNIRLEMKSNMKCTELSKVKLTRTSHACSTFR